MYFYKCSLKIHLEFIILISDDTAYVFLLKNYHKSILVCNSYCKSIQYIAIDIYFITINKTRTNIDLHKNVCCYDKIELKTKENDVYYFLMNDLLNLMIIFYYISKLEQITTYM